MPDMLEYRRGQIGAFEVAMTMTCPTCHSLYFGRTGTNSIRKDGQWAGEGIASAIHKIDGKRRRCRAARFIPMLLMLYPEVPDAR